MIPGMRKTLGQCRTKTVWLKQSSRGLCCQDRPRGARQADRELGELALPAVDRDRAAVLLGDNVPADRQAEPGPFAGRFGREERLKQLVPDLGCNAGAVVAHLDFDRLAEIAR